MADRSVSRLTTIVAGVVCAFLASADVSAAADVPMCERAAKFGFLDELCVKPGTGFGQYDRLRPDDTGRWKDQASSGDYAPNASSQGMTSWQSEWGRRTDWEHVHGWNGFQAFYPYTGRFDHDWLQLVLPDLGRRPVLPPARRENPRSVIR